MWVAPWSEVSGGLYTWVHSKAKDDVKRWTEGALIIETDGTRYRFDGVPHVWYQAADMLDDGEPAILNAAVGRRAFGRQPVLSAAIEEELDAIASKTALTLRRGGVHMLHTVAQGPPDTAVEPTEYATGAVVFTHSAAHLGSGRLSEAPSPRLVDAAVADLSNRLSMSESQLIHNADVFREQTTKPVLGQTQQALACARTWKVPKTRRD